MNKKDFIEKFKQTADLPCEIDADTVSTYLNDNLSDEVEFDPNVFSRCMKLSFDVLKHINETETKKQLDGIISSINEAIDSPAFEKNTDDGNRGQSSDSPDESVISNERNTESSVGLWQKISAKKGSAKSLSIIVFCAVSVLLLPFIMIIAVLCFLTYAIPIALASAITLTVLVPTLVLAVLAIIALSYGIANLFTSPPVGIMEMGLGTVLFSITVVLWALNLRFFTFVIPFLIRKITYLIKNIISRPISFIFGKEVH